MWDGQADLATERERQLTTEHANQTTGLTNGRATNWTPKVEFSPFRELSRRQMTFPFCWEGENESVRSRHYLFLLLLLVIAAFIWQAKIGWYGNGLIDVEKKFNPKPETFLITQVACYPKQL